MLKSLIRDLVCRLLWQVGVTKPQRYARDRLCVLTLHRVLPDELRKQYPLPNLAVSDTEFHWLLLELKQYFRCGPLSEILDAYQGCSDDDRPLLALTFDDGQLDNYEHAKPVLDAHGLKATFYVPVEHIQNQEIIWHDQLAFSVQRCRERGLDAQLSALLTPYAIDATSPVDVIVNATKLLDPDVRLELVRDIEKAAGDDSYPEWAAMMTWSQVQELANEGHEIGSHSMTHPLLTQITPSELDLEISGSKRVIEDHIGCAIRSYCYPDGNHDAAIAERVSEADYSSAVTTDWGLNGPGPMSPFTLNRCNIDAFQLTDRFSMLSRDRLHFRISSVATR